VIGAQMIAAADGSAFTGSVTVSVTGDAGTQATGSVGSGACAHEGNGFHTYAPAQAETNYDHIGFTFTGTGAVPATVQVYTTFPQTGDSFARLGAAGAGLTALATQTSVDDLPTNAELATALGTADDAVLNAIGDLPTNAELATALGTADDAVLAAIGALPTATENADALLNRDMAAVSDTESRSPLNALRFIRNGFSIAGATLTVLKEDDTTPAYTRDLTTDPTADPIVGVD
jgi:hypothetical protein